MMMDDEPLVAVRIKDGIFVGNVTAAHDDDFLLTNKISHVLNCAGSEVKDLFGNAGIHYLTFHWKDQAAMQGLSTPAGIMFDAADHNIEQCVRFLDQGMADGECVLVHDVHGTSRACALVAAYFVAKYGWKIDNALAFMQMAHQEMEIRPHWLKQVRAFARRHDVDMDVFDPEVDDKTFALDNDQWMLRNTLINGLTANVQDTNPLYVQCCKEAPPLETTAKAQQRRRKRVVFTDTNQGTHVDSYTTTPVVSAPPKASHHDPMSNSILGGVGSYLGSGGIAAILEGRRSVVDPIVARRSPVNTRRLESAVDVNAKGRMQLFRRIRAQPQYGTQIQQGGMQHQQQQGGAMGMGDPIISRGGSLNHHAMSTAGSSLHGGNPTPAAVQPNTSSVIANQHIQRMGSPSSAGMHQQQQHEVSMTQRHGTPNSGSAGTTTPLRTATTVQRHAPSVTASNTISHSLSNTTPVQRTQSPMARRTSGTEAANVSAASSSMGTSSMMRGPATSSGNTPAPQRTPMKTATGTVRSPFSIGSSGVAARKGSPLPRQVQSSGYGQQLGTGPAIRREVQSSGYGYGQIVSNRTTTSSRPNSPGPQALSRFGSGTGSDTNARGSSPFVQRGGVSSSRPQSPSQQRPIGGGAPSSSFGAANNSVVRRAMSPRTNTTAGGSSVITGGAGASAIQPNNASSSAIRRANSPLTRTRIGSGVGANTSGMGGGPTSSGYGNMSSYSGSGVGGVSRPNSPMQQRLVGGGVSSQQSGIRPNSPGRRPTTLAEQYLAGGGGVGQHPPSATGGGISRGGANTSTTMGSQQASGSMMRRSSPTPAAIRRY